MGCNIEIGPVFGLPPFYKGGIPAAVKQGLLDITTLRNTAKPMFYTRMRLGEFDPPEMNPFSKLRPEDYVQSKAHQELAIETAMRSFVLLKNQKNLLPFEKGKVFDTIAVIGPMADDLEALYGDYTSQADQNYGSTPRQGLGPMARKVVYAAGCADATTCTKYNSTSVSLATQMAQLTVVCLGTGILIEAESNDRVDLSLPGKQLQLLQDVVKAADGNPIIVLLFNAGPLDISWAQAHPGIHTIMACFFPSQATGAALYRTFYNQGRMANPAGRLPSTWYANIDQVPAITNYSMADRTYRYSSQDFLYPFGYGLSFTNFTYIDVSLNTTVLHAGGAIEVTIILKNTGGLDGEEVIQMYVSWHAPSIPVPKLQLVGFTRDFIPKGQTKKIIMIITYNQLAVWQDNKGFVTLPGTMKLFVGGQQPNQKMKASSNILLANFTVT